MSNEAHSNEMTPEEYRLMVFVGLYLRKLGSTSRQLNEKTQYNDITLVTKHPPVKEDGTPWTIKDLGCDEYFNVVHTITSPADGLTVSLLFPGGDTRPTGDLLAMGEAEIQRAGPERGTAVTEDWAAFMTMTYESGDVSCLKKLCTRLESAFQSQELKKIDEQIADLRVKREKVSQFKFKI